MILITGATGTVGSEVVKRLSAHGIHVRAVTRDPQKAAAQRLPHVQFVRGDFEDVDSMRRACVGVDRAFLVTNSTARTEQQQLAFTRVAQQSGVRHLVKLSQLHADAHAPGTVPALSRRARNGDPSIWSRLHVPAPESLHAGPPALPAAYPAAARLLRRHRRRAHQRGGRA